MALVDQDSILQGNKLFHKIYPQFKIISFFRMQPQPIKTVETGLHKEPIATIGAPTMPVMQEEPHKVGVAGLGNSHRGGGGGVGGGAQHKYSETSA